MGVSAGLNAREDERGQRLRAFQRGEVPNAVDPVLNLIEQPQRRETLVARRCEVDGKLAYRFDIRIQGEGETVFFDF